jgi:hypothetical protein
VIVVTFTAMAQTLTKVLVHFIFSTKNREPWIAQDLEERSPPPVRRMTMCIGS